jgi:hypothetical protein
MNSKIYNNTLIIRIKATSFFFFTRLRKCLVSIYWFYRKTNKLMMGCWYRFLEKQSIRYRAENINAVDGVFGIHASRFPFPF